MAAGTDSQLELARVRRPDLQSGLIIAAHIALTYLPVYLGALSSPGIAWLALWLWFGLSQNALINLMHECAHRLAFRRPWLNDLLGGWLLAPLVLTDFTEYRERHWDHHRHLGSMRDPKVVYRTDIRGVGVLLLAARCALGLEALRRLTERPTEGSSSEAKTKGSGLSVRLILVQAFFLGSVLLVAYASHDEVSGWLLSGLGAYCLIYGYGTASITVLAAALRALAEHQIADDAPLTEGSAALRNLRCNPWTRLAFGTYGFAEHLTHHLNSAVPYYQLQRLTAARGAHDAKYRPRHGYVETLARLVSKPTAAEVAPTEPRG